MYSLQVKINLLRRIALSPAEEQCVMLSTAIILSKLPTGQIPSTAGGTTYQPILAAGLKLAWCSPILPTLLRFRWAKLMCLAKELVRGAILAAPGSTLNSVLVRSERQSILIELNTRKVSIKGNGTHYPPIKYSWYNMLLRLIWFGTTHSNQILQHKLVILNTVFRTAHLNGVL